MAFGMHGFTGKALISLLGGPLERQQAKSGRPGPRLFLTSNSPGTRFAVVLVLEVKSPES